MLSIFTKILVAKLSPLQELLVQQQPPSSSALSPASNSCQARTRNITFPGRTMHQHRLGGEQRLAQPIFWVCGILNPLIRKNLGRKPPRRKPLTTRYSECQTLFRNKANQKSSDPTIEPSWCRAPGRSSCFQFNLAALHTQPCPFSTILVHFSSCRLSKSRSSHHHNLSSAMDGDLSPWTLSFSLEIGDLQLTVLLFRQF
ncbi:uncharacterized protein B0J16DRAFT_52755 [Fusarium flagelliforme]|uniref:uncharacterized protein n=1 Tax=Fusarium flagelliforme TaxID=2675880 RepID=UPI001E8DACA8|nr:uncharacterized protein B0J16DRAFT_52755 [Fusarium flagelliforme]KAH7192030.1 hypothetical protein B0J16DRAFT_52755 [Fusarium flagelliforme]